MGIKIENNGCPITKNRIDPPSNVMVGMKAAIIMCCHVFIFYSAVCDLFLLKFRTHSTEIPQFPCRKVVQQKQGGLIDNRHTCMHY